MFGSATLAKAGGAIMNHPYSATEKAPGPIWLGNLLLICVIAVCLCTADKPVQAAPFVILDGTNAAEGAHNTAIIGAWCVVQSPNVQYRANTLRGIAAVSANDIWAVGYAGEYFGNPR